MVRGFNIDGRGPTVQGRGFDVGSVGFSTGFEVPSDWTISGSDTAITDTADNGGPRNGTYGLDTHQTNSGSDGYATYDGSDMKYAEADFYYSSQNTAYYNCSFIVREQGAGNDLLAVSLDMSDGSGNLRLIEGSASSGWTELTSTSASYTLGASNTYYAVYAAIQPGASGEDVYGTLTLDGTTWTTGEVTPNITSSGRAGFGKLNAQNSGPDMWYDEEDVSSL